MFVAKLLTQPESTGEHGPVGLSSSLPSATNERTFKDRKVVRDREKQKEENKTKAHEVIVVNSAEPEFAGKPLHFHINNIPNVCFLCCVIIIASSSRLNVSILHWFEFERKEEAKHDV